MNFGTRAIGLTQVSVVDTRPRRACEKVQWVGETTQPHVVLFRKRRKVVQRLKGVARFFTEMVQISNVTTRPNLDEDTPMHPKKVP